MSGQPAPTHAMGAGDPDNPARKAREALKAELRAERDSKSN